MASHHPPVVDVDESVIAAVESVIASVESVITSVAMGAGFVPAGAGLESSPHAAKPITAMAVITTTRFNPFNACISSMSSSTVLRRNSDDANRI